MIDINDVLSIHEMQILKHGGAYGLRDRGVLEAVISSPWQTFDGMDLYPTEAEKTARLGFEMITQHPFIDGNKRTGALLVCAYSRFLGYRFKPRSKDFLTAVIGVADGS